MWARAGAVRCSPYIIGTMNQSTSASVANLQLHHNFRWVLCSPHTEPVRGFLSRYLRRRLISTELQTGLRDTHLERVVTWLPSVLERVNKFLENQCSSELTIGTHLHVWYTVTHHWMAASHIICASLTNNHVLCGSDWKPLNQLPKNLSQVSISLLILTLAAPSAVCIWCSPSIGCFC